MVSRKDRRSAERPAERPIDEDRRLSSGRDRRQFERVLVDLEVDYRCEDTFLFAYITDISAMGIFVQTNSPEPSGTKLNLRFMVPSQKLPFELEGEVIWVNPYRPGDRENLNPGMGVRFVDLTQADRERLTELVKTFAYLDDDTLDESQLGETEDGDDDEEEADGHDGRHHGVPTGRA
jgi:type IV pilus assembly protein PilZ